MWCMSQGKGPCRYSSSMQLSFPGCPPCCDVMLKLYLCLERGGEGPPFVFAHLCARLCRGVCCGGVCVGGGAAHRRADTQTGKWEDGRVWFVRPRFFQRRFDWVHLCVEELERRLYKCISYGSNKAECFWSTGTSRWVKRQSLQIWVSTVIVTLVSNSTHIQKVGGEKIQVHVSHHWNVTIYGFFKSILEMLGCLGPYVELQHTARHTERCHFKKKKKKNPHSCRCTKVF